MRWIEHISDRSVARTAHRIGLAYRPPGEGQTAAQVSCVSCGAETRHTKSGDKRLAANVTEDDRRWHCFQCEEGGDDLDLVAHHLHRRRLADLEPARRADVRRWFGVSDGPPPEMSDAEIAAAYPNMRRLFDAPAGGVREAEDHDPHRGGASLPPEAEVTALWASSVPVTADDDVSGWLRTKRGLDPVAVARLDLARSLAPADLPTWAMLGTKSWYAAGHRAVFPLVDHQGATRSFVARRLTDGEPKSIPPRGHGRARLIFANAAAVSALRDGAPPAQLVMAEGEMDFVAWSIAVEDGVAVIGVLSGSWCPEFAARLIGPGTRVLIATDPDEAGEKYARKIMETIGPDIAEVRRWRDAGGRDANDVVRAGGPLVSDGALIPSDRSVGELLVPIGQHFGLAEFDAVIDANPLDLSTLPGWPRYDESPEADRLHPGSGHGLGPIAGPMLGVVRPGDFVLVGAPSAGFGKSALVLGLADGLALRNVVPHRQDDEMLSPVVIASEMSGEAVSLRSLARMVGVPTAWFRSGRRAFLDHDGNRSLFAGPAVREARDRARAVLSLGPYQEARARWQFTTTISERGVEWVEKVRRGVAMLRGRIAAEGADVCPVLIVDPVHRQLGDGNEVEELNALAKALADAASADGFVVIATSDTNKAATAAKSRSDAGEAGAFRGSYVLQHVASTVLFLRPAKDATPPQGFGEVELVFVKNRFGPARGPWPRFLVHYETGRFLPNGRAPDPKDAPKDAPTASDEDEVVCPY